MDEDPGENVGNSKHEALGLNPTAFVDDVINAVNDYCADGFDALEEYVQNTLPDLSPTVKQALVEGVDSVYDIVQAAADKHFAHFEAHVLANSFAIPRGLVMPSPDVCQTSGDAQEIGQDDSRLDEELDSLRQKLAHNQSVVGSLRRDLRAVERELSRTRQPAEVLQTALQSGGLTDSSGDVADAATRLQALMRRAEALRVSRANGFQPHKDSTCHDAGKKAILEVPVRIQSTTTADLMVLHDNITA